MAIEAAVESKQSIAAEVTGYESWLAENDGSLVATAAGIKLAAKLAQENLKKSKDVGEEPPEAAAFLKTMQATFAKATESMPNEISLAMAGIRYDKQGNIRVIGRARLVHGGTLSKGIAAIPPVKEDLFAEVPGGPFVVAAAGVAIPGVMERYLNLSAEILKSLKTMGGMPGDELGIVTKESFEAARLIRSMSFVMKLGKRTEPIYSNMFFTMNVENSEDWFKVAEKYAAAASKVWQKAKQPFIKSLTVKRLQVGGKPAMQQELTFDFSSLPGAEQSQAMLDAMFGVGGKMVSYIVAADEHTVVMGMGVPQERMLSALDVLKQPNKSLAKDAEVSATAAMLPEGSQWVAYVSFRGYAQLITRTITMAMKNMPGGETFGGIPTFPKSPPMGIAVKAAAGRVARRGRRARRAGAGDRRLRQTRCRP